MNTFFDKTGPMAMATRMRLLSERLTKESEKIFDLYNNDLKAKWYPVFFCLMQDDNLNSVTTIAKEIGQSHVSIVKIIKELIKEKIVYEVKDEKDARKTNIFFTKKGEEIVKGLKLQHKDASLAMFLMLEKMQNNLWESLGEFEKAFEEKSTYLRVLEEKEKRENKKITIIAYKEEYKKDFISLNEKWIKKYFKMEDKDIESLKNPKEFILDKGGFIYLAILDKKVIGVCALIKSQNPKFDFELSKMVVDSSFQNRGVAYNLALKCIKKAKEKKAKSIFLDSNTLLIPAINLYKKLGFKEVKTDTFLYERTNIQMSLDLKD